MDFSKIKNILSSFWFINIAGWLTYLTVLMLFVYTNSLQNIKFIAGIGLTYLAGFIISSFLRYIFHHIEYKRKSLLKLGLQILLISAAAGLAWDWLDILMTMSIGTFDEIAGRRTIHSYAYNVIWRGLFLYTWSALYFLIKFWKEWSLQKERTEKANLLAQKAQLKMLRYQLNPHFLFNSLNSLRALIEEDKNKAKWMIGELSEFLRYSLATREFSNIPLKNEIQACRHYFSVEKTRFEEKLEISFDIDPLAEEFPVLSFLIHPLIENAVKYGMKTSGMPLKIIIGADIQNNNLHLKICNSGRWIEPDENHGTGAGLNNVKNRLENAYPGRSSMKIEKSDGMVCIHIYINGEIE